MDWATDGTSSVSFFRYTTNLSITFQMQLSWRSPQARFLISLSMDTRSIQTIQDFQQGQYPQTYMYDVHSLLQPGLNVFGVEVSNFNVQEPMLRVGTGFVQGNSIILLRNWFKWVESYNAERYRLSTRCYFIDSSRELEQYQIRRQFPGQLLTLRKTHPHLRSHGLALYSMSNRHLVIGWV